MNQGVVGEYYMTPKNVIIAMLCVLLIFNYIGINLLDILNNLLTSVIRIFGPLITTILSTLGYTTGIVLNKSADIAGDTGKAAIDIAEGTVQSVGNLMIKASKRGMNTNSLGELENAMQLNDNLMNVPSNDMASNQIQKPISSNKAGWCLVGEYESKRGCVGVDQHDKCLSGKIYPSKEECMSPNN